MKKTYAYNSIIIGVLIGIWAYGATDSTALGIVAFLAVSIIGFFAIRALENALSTGIDKAVDATANAIQNYTQNKDK